MLDDLLEKESIKEMKPYEKEIEKTKRERNRFAGEIKILIKEVQKRERILETTEAYLVQRIEKSKESGVSKTAIYELEILLNGLKEERSAIHNCCAKRRS